MGRRGQLAKQRVCFAPLLNALVSPRPPATWPVLCKSYLSICHKQLGNYDYDDRINKPLTEVAERLVKGGAYRNVGKLNSVIFMLLGLYAVFLHYSFLSPFIPDFFTPLLVSLSRTFIKGALPMRDSGGPA